MATVRIYHGEAVEEEMPRVCMRCGAESELFRSQTFAWMPPWVHVLLFFGLLPWVIVALILRKTMRVEAPVCRRHANHWRARKLYIWLGLLWWIAYGVAVALVVDQVDQDAANVLVGVAVIGGLLWLVVGLLLVHGSIRAGEITNEWMDLVNVHREFAQVWKEIHPPIPPVVRGPRRRRPLPDDEEERLSRD
jgi:hypothetical protein